MMNKTHKTIDFRLKDTDNSALRKEENPGQRFSKIERMVNEFEKYGPPEGKDFETAQREVFFRGVDTGITMEQNRHVSQESKLTFLQRTQLSVASQETETQKHTRERGLQSMRLQQPSCNDSNFMQTMQSAFMLPEIVTAHGTAQTRLEEPRNS